MKFDILVAPSGERIRWLRDKPVLLLPFGTSVHVLQSTSPSTCLELPLQVSLQLFHYSIGAMVTTACTFRDVRCLHWSLGLAASDSGYTLEVNSKLIRR